jgi:hypothetical protein
MASRILKARDDFFATVSANGWTKYTDLTVEAKELTAFPAVICTPADQSGLAQLSNGKFKISSIKLLFSMLVQIDSYNTPTAALQILFGQFEAWFDAGTVKAETDSVDFFKTAINNKIYYGISLIITI